MNPTTDAVETEFDSGNQIDSMSTDPTGSLLYTGGQTPNEVGMTVREYNAQTGAQFATTYERAAVAVGTVAATDGGVWESFRTGMAGGSVELSAVGLRSIAGPTTTPKNDPFLPGPAIMGIGSKVSEGTLWLTTPTALACANPKTGAVRTGEQTSVGGPIAEGSVLYAVAGLGTVVLITPPAKCFG